ncbi:MAG: hypothetical protein WC794_05915 [Candidatus Doudnabacteria bacterium]|jgi:hypothetical protein
MSRLTKFIYIILFLILLLHPHLLPDHVGFLPKAYAETIITLFIFGAGFLLYQLHKRDLAKKERELKSSSEKLADAFKYIGTVNRRLPLLKSLTTDLLASSKLSKKEKLKIFQDLLATALVSVAKVNWGLLRFIDTDSGKTVKEFIFTTKEYVVVQNSIGNKELLQSRQQSSSIKSSSNLFIIPTTEQEAIIQGHLVFPKPAESLEDERWVLQAITDQAQLFFKYLY